MNNDIYKPLKLDMGYIFKGTYGKIGGLEIASENNNNLFMETSY